MYLIRKKLKHFYGDWGLGIRSNSIYTFSKRVSYNSINTNINNSINNSNNNQEKDNKILFEDLKINNSNIKKLILKIQMNY